MAHNRQGICFLFLRLLSLVFLTTFAATAQAATISETDFAGGFGSNSQFFNQTYTAIGSGFDVVNGTSSAGSFDFIQFTDLAAGAQTVSFNLALINPAGAFGFGNAGGEIRYSTTQTSGPYTNNTSAGTFNLFGGNFVPAGFDTTTLSFSLDNSFAGGDLFVNVLQTFGNRSLSYSMAVPGNALPAAVPLPASSLLLLSALGAFVLRGRSRRRDLHHSGFAAT